MNCQPQMRTVLAVLTCPTDSSPRLSTQMYQWTGITVAVTNYKGCIGTSNMGGGWPDSPMGLTDNHYNRLPTGLFFRNSYQVKIRMTDIKDGTANTFMIGEDLPEQNHHSAAFYANGDYASCHAPLNFFPNPPDPDNWPRVISFSSKHPNGANFLFGDGHVVFIPNSIDLASYKALSTRDRGEVVTPP